LLSFFHKEEEITSFQLHQAEFFSQRYMPPGIYTSEDLMLKHCSWQCGCAFFFHFVSDSGLMKLSTFEPEASTFMSGTKPASEKSSPAQLLKLQTCSIWETQNIVCPLGLGVEHKHKRGKGQRGLGGFPTRCNIEIRNWPHSSSKFI
jgi:hypothetical protein